MMSTEYQARTVAQDQANATGETWVIYRDAASGEWDAGSQEVTGIFLENTAEEIDSIQKFEPSEERRKITVLATDAVLNAKNSPGLYHGIHLENGNHAEVIFETKTDLWYIAGFDKGVYLASDATAALEYILTRPAPSRQDGGGDKLPTPAEMFDLLNFAYTTLGEARESYYFEEQRLTRRKRELEEQETKLRASGALDLGEKVTDTQRKAKLFDLTAPERALIDSTKDGVDDAAYKLKMAEDEVARARANLRILELAAGIDRDNHR